jgi:translation initiation factor IF-1
MQNRRPVHRNSSPKPSVSTLKPGLKPAPKAGEDEKEEGIEVMGKVVEKFRAGMFSIELEGGQTVLAAMAGRLRRNRIRIMNGDRVTLELSPYDLTRGRITYRHK